MKTKAKELREKSGMSATGLAAKIGCDPSWVRQVEAGLCTMKLEAARRYAKGLGCHVADLILSDSEMKQLRKRFRDEK